MWMSCMRKQIQRTMGLIMFLSPYYLYIQASCIAFLLTYLSRRNNNRAGRRARKKAKYTIIYTMIGKKMLALFLAALPAVLVFVAPDVHDFVASKVWTAGDKKWTTQDLANMSKTKTMAVAVTEMTSSAVRKSGIKKALKLNE